jgi:hypothetical protein
VQPENALERIEVVIGRVEPVVASIFERYDRHPVVESPEKVIGVGGDDCADPEGLGVGASLTVRSAL